MTLPQLRVLVMVASSGPLNLAAVADGLGVHPSNATRACDRLVTAGLLDRRDNPDDRRNLVLGLTGAGQRLVEELMSSRRKAIEKVVARMPAEHRRGLVVALRSFVEAAGERPLTESWALGWTTAPAEEVEHERAALR
ncbi:MAG TPA: MarR family winged helix-turn-helix transcriptional regulator [Pseudonocardiaceae bacterium]|nr:MarR family winged helix-turn-helix transcriptional regulator [Pseudonocardiaceae bacterium]